MNNFDQIKQGDIVTWIPNAGIRFFGPLRGIFDGFQNNGALVFIYGDNGEGLQRRAMEDGTLTKDSATA